ncbi:MAG: ATP-binding protein, partial [Clostridia bacterium]|nr:ATP-binding protein [Clostridia bacterium]
GVAVELDGRLPEDPAENYLLAAALRECVTNALRHAGADSVFVRVTREGGLLRAVFTNNGRPPKASVREGGGIASLREKAAQAGAAVTIRSLPDFALTLEIPQRGESL